MNIKQNKVNTYFEGLNGIYVNCQKHNLWVNQKKIVALKEDVRVVQQLRRRNE